MSLQRIVELARRQGMPIIMTDVAGREPMVLLSLDEYEEMLDGGSKPTAKAEAQRPSPSSQAQKPTPPTGGAPQQQPIAPPTHEPQKDGLRMRQRDEDRTEALHRSLDSVSHEVNTPNPSQNRGGDGAVLEEGFAFQS